MKGVHWTFVALPWIPNVGPFKILVGHFFYNLANQYMGSYMDWQHIVDVTRIIMENTFIICNSQSVMLETVVVLDLHFESQGMLISVYLCVTFEETE